MKILMLTWEYPPRIIGGISRVVYDLAQNLGKLNNEVHVLTCWEPGTEEYEIDGYVKVHRVHVYNNPSYNFVEWVMQLNFSMLEYAIQLIQNNDFDIVHAHDWLVAYAAKVIKYSYHIPLITTIHATEHGRNNGIYTDMQRTINNVEKWLVNESDRIIVNSNFMKDQLITIFDLEKEKICVISNGVDLKKFECACLDWAFREKYAAHNEKIVFFVGRLVNEKGLDILLHAIPKIISSHNEVKFVIAGKGPYLNNLIELSHHLNIINRVNFIGFVSDEDLLKLYKCADIAVFPSLYEPFGIVALEGMVAGVPVVVSDTGGLREIVNHKEDGMKFYCGNSNSLADCIIELLKDQELSNRIRDLAFQKVHKLYNWGSITELTLSEYKFAISQYRSSN